jgi:predicted CoA-binding protein
MAPTLLPLPKLAGACDAEAMSFRHQNDPDLIRELLIDPGIWVVVGLSNNQEREAFGVSRWLKVELGKGLIPVHPKAETVHGEPGYASLSDIPDGTDIKVVDCFVNSEHVGAVVDEAIADKDRLMIDAIWMQLGVVDEAAADRARAAGLDVVMDTCPRIEWRGVRSAGMAR